MRMWGVVTYLLTMLSRSVEPKPVARSAATSLLRFETIFPVDQCYSFAAPDSVSTTCAKNSNSNGKALLAIFSMQCAFHVK